ncbi:MAG: lytic murein transglycosylase [Elusimicrobia bacterium]|nr:lytic murein transglycosylase [Elusimicrobiota bacterium]
MIRVKPISALLLLAAAAAPSSAQAVGEAAFFGQLRLISADIKTEIAQASAFRDKAAELTKEDAFRMVLARIPASEVPEDYVRAAFDDPETRLIPEIPGRFRPGPSQPSAQPYSQYLGQAAAAGAVFYADHKELLDRVEKAYGVDAGILASLVGVETFYGTNTGRYPVFSTLYTIMVELPGRRDWAANELAEWLRLCRRNGINPHGVKGSYAGAFGYFQFMPSSFNRFGVDFDGDGRVAFDQWPDVLASVANYLKLAGWETGGGFQKPGRNYSAIFAYNHSDGYVKSIVQLRAEILKRTDLGVAGN